MTHLWEILVWTATGIMLLNLLIVLAMGASYALHQDADDEYWGDDD